MRDYIARTRTAMRDARAYAEISLVEISTSIGYTSISFKHKPMNLNRQNITSFKTC